VIALFATAVLVCYLLIPNAIFRLTFSLLIPARNYARTRSEELTTAALISIAPFALALWVTFHVTTPPSAQAWSDHKQLLHAAIYAENAAKMDSAALWSLATRVAMGHGHFFLWYWPAIALEALLLGLAGRQYGEWCRRGPLGTLYGHVAAAVILPLVSEWHLLLTPFILPKHTRILVDVLTTDDHLYRGQGEPFVDRDGKLTMVMITDASRFDRPGYLDAKKMDPQADRDMFWKTIPGKKLYAFADKITNINVRYGEPIPPAVIELAKKLGANIVEMN
jgi:hypothetical protein